MEASLTIEQLAAETGLSVRNLRSHRARGLLQPPVVRDRIGYYGPEHVARVRLIQQLQAEGFNLAAIKRVVETTRGDDGSLLSLSEITKAPFETEQAQVLTTAELAERFRVDDAPRILELAVRAGVLIDLGDGRYEAPAPSLLEVADELVERGVPLHHVLKVAEKVQAATTSVAREFIRLALDDIWRPFEADGFPPARWGAIAESIERLRPMSAQAVLAIYQLTMTAEVERAWGQELQRLTRGAG